MADRSVNVEVIYKPVKEEGGSSHGAKLGDGPLTGGEDSDDAAIIGTKGGKLPHNRFCCSEVRVTRNNCPVFSKMYYYSRYARVSCTYARELETANICTLSANTRVYPGNATGRGGGGHATSRECVLHVHLPQLIPGRNPAVL